MTPAQQLENRVRNIIAISRDLTTAAGSVGYTGLGFKPSLLVISYGIQAGAVSLGTALWIDGNPSKGGFVETSGGLAYLTDQIFVESSSGNYQSGALTSFDADGFTINWTKAGSPSGTLLAYVLGLA